MMFLITEKDTSKRLPGTDLNPQELFLFSWDPTIWKEVFLGGGGVWLNPTRCREFLLGIRVVVKSHNNMEKSNKISPQCIMPMLPLYPAKLG